MRVKIENRRKNNGEVIEIIWRINTKIIKFEENMMGKREKFEIIRNCLNPKENWNNVELNVGKYNNSEEIAMKEV